MWLVTGFLVLAACGTTTAEEGPATTGAAPPSTTPATSQPPRNNGTNPAGIEALVIHVDDGDSIIVEIGGRQERVRLIGINAPEQGECLGDVSRQYLTNQLAGRTVILESDLEEADEFGRLLRYVWFDGIFINELLAREGLAIARDYEPNVARRDMLDDAQRRAQESGAGMWAAEACGTAGAIDIAILAIQSDPAGPDEQNLNGEFVIFENLGDVSTDLGGYELRDNSSSNRYRFPDGFTVDSGGRFVVYVGCGDDNDVELYWCHDGPVWNNSGDEVFLSDPNGNIVTYESY